MAVGQYNIGSDSQVTFVSDGGVVNAAILTSFNAKQITTKLKSVGIDGVNRYRELEEGWEGTAGYDRADSVMDDYFANKEANRYSGLPAPIVTITETTTNALDGSIVKYRYDGTTMKLDDIGARDGDKKVEQKISFTSSRRIKVL
jgi:hypothetical protein